MSPESSPISEIEFGKLLYWNRNPDNSDRVPADRAKLRLLALLLAAFFIGGVIGAIGFSQAGFLFALPFALLLLLAGPPLAEDASTLTRQLRKR
jgi:hypothetical protein